MGDDLADITRELYAELPGDFIRARDARVKALRSKGARDLAGQVKALRRPTVAAWLVNLLAHEPGALDPLTELGEQLREAQSRLAASEMKSLSAQRPSLVENLVAEAVRLAVTSDGAFEVTAPIREQVTATLTAALADPRAELAVTSGQLVTALSYAGFGEVEIGDSVATPLRILPDPTPAPAAPPKTPPGPTAAEIAQAQAKVTVAAHTLEVAEAALAQARARRTAARREWESATAALEALEKDPHP
ncbi:hypothetical protein [Demetria terragena]|uniref:hypothetical protein n=1 Tax=Demetria terragena TaxID=63959 RepID=UPI000380771F|nr:hypothetical protein [Demetria terragena]